MRTASSALLLAHITSTFIRIYIKIQAAAWHLLQQNTKITSPCLYEDASLPVYMLLAEVTGYINRVR